MKPETLADLEEVDERYAIRFVRQYDVAADEVWDALTDAERLGDWLSPTRVDLRVGGRIEIDFGSEQLGGSILVCEPERVLEFEWNPKDEAPSIVRFELEPHAGGTRLTLTHRRQVAADARGTLAGWHAQLDLLRGHIAGKPVDWDTSYNAAKLLYRDLVRTIPAA